MSSAAESTLLYARLLNGKGGVGGSRLSQFNTPIVSEMSGGISGKGGGGEGRKVESTRKWKSRNYSESPKKIIAVNGIISHFRSPKLLNGDRLAAEEVVGSNSGGGRKEWYMIIDNPT